MTAHKHAALMLQYAQDAAETDKPWERWEYRAETYSEWRTLRWNPLWLDSIDYRRKPERCREVQPDGTVWDVDPSDMAWAQQERKPTLICNTCGADRFVEDCKGVRSMCPLFGTTQTIKETP